MPESEDWPNGRPVEPADRKPATDPRTGQAAAAIRMDREAEYVDLQVQQAIKRGEFDDLPGAGKPIEGLDGHHDPNWWIKNLVEREKVAVLPPSVQLRKDDAELDDRMDAEPTEQGARRVVEDFNDRVIAARYGAPEGPPLITMPREVETALSEWRARKSERAEEWRRRAAAGDTGRSGAPKRRWWQRRSR